MVTYSEPTVQGGRFDGMPLSVMENAEKANCSRCEAKIIDTPSIAGTVFVNYYVPTLGIQVRGFLCGDCGLSFREFLMPSLTDDQAFQALAAGLRAEWDK